MSQIENDVLTAAEESGVSEMKLQQIRDIFKKLDGDRNEIICYVVNLTLAAEGLKSIPHKTIRKKAKYE